MVRSAYLRSSLFKSLLADSPSPTGVLSIALSFLSLSFHLPHKLLSISKPLLRRFPFCILNHIAFTPLYQLSGLTKLKFPHSLLQNRGLVGQVCKKMCSNVKGRDVGVEFTPRVVVPATDAHVEDAIGAIKAGEVIAVPTDTLYGFACDACSAEAVNRIYEIKGRQQTSPLAICLGDVLDIDRFAVTDQLPRGLLDVLLPGPVTVVLRRGVSSILEKSLNPGVNTIGVRVPDYNFIRAIARGSRSALALTSANISGQPSSVCIKDFENLWGHCSSIYDGGLLPSGPAGSTVVDLTRQGMYKILRPGSALGETIAVLQRYSLQEEELNSL